MATRFAVAEGFLQTKLKTVDDCPNCSKIRRG